MRVSNSLRAGLMGCVAAAALGGGAQARSLQDETAAPMRDVIVVTAQKREELISDVPASISVVGGTQLQELGAQSVLDYAAYVPGMNVSSGGTPGRVTITLRGIAPIGPSATVGTFVDDAPLGSSSNYADARSFQLDLMPYDIERIEILRGPQGTLYGASTMGGLLKYVMRNPQMEGFGAQAGVEAVSVADGDGLGWGARGRIEGALVEGRLGASLSLFTQETPGYIDNAVTGEDGQNVLTQTGGRFAMRLQASPRLTIDLTAMAQDTEADNNGQVFLDPISLQPIYGERQSGNVVAEPYSKEERFYSIDFDWGLDWADLVSITSYSTSVNDLTQDTSPIFGTLFPLLTGGAVPAGRSGFLNVIELEKFTQEFRLASTGEGQLNWLVGAFYTDEEADQYQFVSAMDSNNVTIPGLHPLAVVNLPTSYQEQAVFGNVSYAFTDRFEATVGGRWASNDQTYNQVTTGPLIGDTDITGQSSEDVFTYLGSARFDLTEATMLYARVASSYRPGGPNAALPGVPPSFDSDTLVNYEAGVKSDFWGGRGVVEAAAFWIDWSDIQLNVVVGGIGHIANGGSARSRGVELATTVRPSDNLDLGFNASWTEAELTEDAPSLFALSGDRLPETPQLNASVTAGYSWAIAGDWTARAGGGLRYVGDRNVSFPGNPDFMVLDSYAALDLNAEISNGTWSLRGYVRNATDEGAYTGATRLSDAFGQPVYVVASPLQPRTVGISLSVAR